MQKYGCQDIEKVSYLRSLHNKCVSCFDESPLNHYKSYLLISYIDITIYIGDCAFFMQKLIPSSVIIVCCYQINCSYIVSKFERGFI